MKIVVGVQPDAAGDEAVACAAALARAMRADLVLTHVHPTPWGDHQRGEVDSEWEAYLVAQARGTLQRAQARLALDGAAPASELRIHAHTSSGRGLAEVADAVGAALIVIGAAGASSDGPSGGRLHGGSTADQLLHGAGVPVLLVPHGHALGRRPFPARVTVAYQRSLDSDEALRAAVQLCRRTGAPLRLVTLVVQPPRVLPTYERALDELRADARAWLDTALVEAPFGTRLTAEIVEGADLEHALAGLDSDPDELLVCGSGSGGPLRRVFLGDTAQKILRGATVPVLVVPRHADPELDRTQGMRPVSGRG